MAEQQGALCGGGCRDCGKPTPNGAEWCQDCMLALIRERHPDWEPADLEPVADADRVAEQEAAAQEADDQVEATGAARRETAEVAG